MSKKEEKMDSKELIYILYDLCSNKQFKKPSPLPKFNLQEALFIRDLIFWKPKGLLFHYLADYLMNDTIAKHMPMFNAPAMRKLRFIFNFLNSRSAKEAAIKAGYSPKTAKQQASRTLREIHGYKRVS
jgi:hypothetical protein